MYSKALHYARSAYDAYIKVYVIHITQAIVWTVNVLLLLWYDSRIIFIRQCAIVNSDCISLHTLRKTWMNVFLYEAPVANANCQSVQVVLAALFTFHYFCRCKFYILYIAIAPRQKKPDVRVFQIRFMFS